MKKVFGIVGQLLILIFAALVIGYTSTLTFILSARILPDNIFLQAMTVVLFDGGALIWFVMFITKSNSIWQWALSAISWFLSLGGVALMAGGEILLSQKLFEFDNYDQLGLVLVVSCIVAAIYHAVAIYLFHLTDAKILAHIEDETSLASQESAVLSAARADMESGNDPRTEQMKNLIKDAWQRKMTARMMLAASGYSRSAETINAEAQQILASGRSQPQLPSPQFGSPANRDSQFAMPANQASQFAMPPHNFDEPEDDDMNFMRQPARHMQQPPQTIFVQPSQPGRFVPPVEPLVRTDRAFAAETPDQLFAQSMNAGRASFEQDNSPAGGTSFWRNKRKKNADREVGGPLPDPFILESTKDDENPTTPRMGLK